MTISISTPNCSSTDEKVLKYFKYFKKLHYFTFKRETNATQQTLLAGLMRATEPAFETTALRPSIRKMHLDAKGKRRSINVDER